MDINKIAEELGMIYVPTMTKETHKNAQEVFVLDYDVEITVDYLKGLVAPLITAKRLEMMLDVNYDCCIKETLINMTRYKDGHLPMIKFTINFYIGHYDEE